MFQKYIIVFFTVFCGCFVSACQHSYGQGILLKSSVLKEKNGYELYSYRNGQKILVDSAFVRKEGEIDFSLNQTLQPGMYLINTPANLNNGAIWILISNRQKEQLIITQKQNGAIEFQNSDENNAYAAYLEIAGESFNKQDNLKKEWMSTGDSTQLKEIGKQSAIEAKKLYDLGMQTAQAFPGTLLSVIINCNNTPPVPSGEFKSYLTDISSQRYKDATDFIRKNYWKGVNFSDTILLRTPFLYSKVEQYVRQFNPIDPKLPEITIELLNKCGTNEQLFEVIANALFTIYNKEGSPIRNEDAAEAVLNTSLTKSFIPEWKKAGIREQVKIINKNKTGSIASDITLQDDNGKTFKLHSFKSKYTLLYFFDSDCSSCKRTTPVIKDWLEHQAPEELKVWGIYIEQDQKLWEKYLNENKSPSSWINLWDKNEEGKLREKYWIEHIPAIYLLDANKKIVLKNASFKELVNFFGTK